MKRTPLARSGPIKRRGHKDPVTPELRAAVLERDGGCVAPLISGWYLVEFCEGPLQLDHVREQPMMGKRAPSDMAHLAAVCRAHHTENGWATSHRPALRAYLRRVNHLAAFSPEEEHPV